MNSIPGGILNLNTPDLKPGYAADIGTVVLFGDDMGESESDTTSRYFCKVLYLISMK